MGRCQQCGENAMSRYSGTKISDSYDGLYIAYIATYRHCIACGFSDNHITDRNKKTIEINFPVKIGEKVYVIINDYENCPGCQYDIGGRCAEYCIDGDSFIIVEREVEAYLIYRDKQTSKLSISLPGRNGNEGVEEYVGVDGMVYTTYELAEEGLKRFLEEKNDNQN